MGKKILSEEECMLELSEIVRDKEKSSASERMKAIGLLIDLKNKQLEKQNIQEDNMDNSLNITIDYGEKQ